MVVVELFDSLKESDGPQHEDLGSLLFRFCHLEVFAGAANGLFKFGAFLVADLNDE